MALKIDLKLKDLDDLFYRLLHIDDEFDNQSIIKIFKKADDLHHNMSYSNFIADKYNYPVDFFKAVNFFLSKEQEIYGCKIYFKEFLAKVKSLLSFLYDKEETIHVIYTGDWNIEELYQFIILIQDLYSVSITNEKVYHTKDYLDNLLSIVDMGDGIRSFIKDAIVAKTRNVRFDILTRDNYYTCLKEIENILSIGYMDIEYEGYLLQRTYIQYKKAKNKLFQIAYRFASEKERKEALKRFNNIQRQHKTVFNEIDIINNDQNYY